MTDSETNEWGVWRQGPAGDGWLYDPKTRAPYRFPTLEAAADWALAEQLSVNNSMQILFEHSARRFDDGTDVFPTARDRAMLQRLD